MVIPSSVVNLERAGVVLENLCAESYRQVRDEYFIVLLEAKYVRDEESIAMIDMIMDSRIFDFGYVYGGWGCVFWIQYMLEGATKDITSYYEKNFGAYEKTMEKVFEAFDTYTLD